MVIFRFLVDCVIKPVFFIVGWVVFGGVFVFFGFSSVTVDMQRNETGRVDASIVRSHVWGLYRMPGKLEGVTEAGYKTSRSTSRRIHGGRQRSLVSRLSLVSETDQLPLTFSSNFDRDKKRRMLNALNGYIQGTDTQPFHETFSFNNFFGWVGIPFVLMGIFGLLSWPWKITKFFRNQNRSGE